MNYKDLRPTLKTGDVVAFSGKGRVSSIIKRFTNSEVSHVGVVVKDHSFGVEQVMIAESTTLSDVACVVSGKPHAGAQLVPLSSRLRRYEGEVWVYPIDIDASFILTSSGTLAMQVLMQWIREERPYDTIQAMGSALDWWDRFGWENDPDFSSLFCSEMVARFFQIAGYLPEEFNPSEATPADVVDFDFLNKPVEVTLNG